ncbi:hypothetical protein [endosymbiont of Ridgeia piscesae]|jgi:peptidoglycan hydrolase CwlO-like protein|uniref:Uncharacterized protein n=2 Tax=sulfur-oxidizing symbionts TaxID=32036 RepID=A0A0T5Z2L4_9GAMM|nr:hypothetical protein [endosymbiont of Ridgeia piscesae]KRT54970.1 hypothetical protein Ga0074115_11225 [endosymbiont of Ridgeia piscesae]KRT57148.1 hypothetical protein Ga0076813_11063 [endosymbiont of Ridgeia piscesae]
MTKKTKESTTAEAEGVSDSRESESRLLPGLLHSIFDRMHKENRDSGKAQEKIIHEFTARLTDAFNEVHAESKERERLLEEKLKAIEQEQEYKIRRIKFLSVPGTIIATACMVYLFYVVHVMETSMTSMSDDMHHMRGYISSISGDTRVMSSNVVTMNNHMADMNGNIGSVDEKMGNMNSEMGDIKKEVKGMNGNMTHLNRSVGVMTRDVGAMSHTISPVMGSMGKFMPF